MKNVILISILAVFTANVFGQTSIFAVAADDESVCDGETVTLMNYSIGAKTYSWEENIAGVWTQFSIDETSEFEQTFAVGSHDIRLVVDKGLASENIAGTQTLVVNATSTDPILANTYGPACENDPKMTLITSDANGTYIWSGTGVALETGQYYFYPSTAGVGTHTLNYTYTLNATGCSVSDTKDVTVYALPIVTFTAEETDVCVNSTGNVYATQSGQSNYTWTVSSGGTITSGTGTNSIIVTWNTVGAQIVSVNYDNSNGCSASSAAVSNVTVNSLPIPTLTSSDADNMICIGDNVTFTVAGGSIYEFFVNGRSVQSPSMIAIYSTTALVNGDVVTVKVTNSNGCEETSVGIMTTVNALPVSRN